MYVKLKEDLVIIIVDSLHVLGVRWCWPGNCVIGAMGGALMTVGKARGVYGNSARNIELGGTFDPSNSSVFSVESGKSHQPRKATHHST